MHSQQATDVHEQSGEQQYYVIFVKLSTHPIMQKHTKRAHRNKDQECCVIDSVFFKTNICMLHIYNKFLNGDAGIIIFLFLFFVFI